MILLCLAVLCLLLAVRVVVLAPRRAAKATATRIATYTRVPDVAAAPVHRSRVPQLAEAVARVVLRVSPKTSRPEVAARLAAAGVGSRVTADMYLAAKGGAATIAALAGFGLAGASGKVGSGLVAAVVFAVIAFVLPDVLLRARARRRNDQIVAALPNALDLLAVSVEAGLGLDAALVRYAETARGPLAEEFARVISELRVGMPRADAMRRFADRVEAPETSAFARAVLNADQLGVSLTQTLRVQAVEVRRRRQARAEELANKMPVKLLFPTVFFILPALFIVALGPALLLLSHVIN